MHCRRTGRIESEGDIFSLCWKLKLQEYDGILFNDLIFSNASLVSTPRLDSH